MITFDFFIVQFIGYWFMLIIIWLFGRFVKKIGSMPRIRKIF
jgi:hypothetical protein